MRGVSHHSLPYNEYRIQRYNKIQHKNCENRLVIILISISQRKSIKCEKYIKKEENWKRKSIINKLFDRIILILIFFNSIKLEWWHFLVFFHFDVDLWMAPCIKGVILFVWSGEIFLTGETGPSSFFFVIHFECKYGELCCVYVVCVCMFNFSVNWKT